MHALHQQFPRLIVLDTETTGLPESDKKGNQDFTRVHICRVSWLIYEAGAVEVHDHLVQLPDGVDIHPSAAKVNGLTKEQCNADGSTIEVVIHSMRESLFCRPPAAIAGHNLIAFDLPLLHRHGLVIHHPVLDTKLIFQAVLSGRRRPRYQTADHFYGSISDLRIPSSLDMIAELLIGASRSSATHNSVEDCRLCHSVLCAMWERGVAARVLSC
jgi:DNA polymerase III epsilon subunit-like protein